MLRRLVTWVVQSYIRGPARSWIYTSLALWALRMVRKVTGRQPVVERLKVSPGDNLTIDHLQISHRAQIKQQKRERRAGRRRRRQSTG